MLRTYTETYDINTADGKPTLLGLHTPIGRNPYHFLYPAFMMYEKYKYLGCDVSVVNQAHLPVSLEQYDIEGGQQNMDPRDSLNPILFRGCHGNSMGNMLDSIYAGFDEVIKSASTDKGQLNADFQNFYYTALGDNGWRKSPINKTLRINGLHPLVYRMATNIQINPVNMDVGDYDDQANLNSSQALDLTDGGSVPGSNQREQAGGADPVAWQRMYRQPTDIQYNPFTTNTINWATYKNSMFTSGMQSLGWLDTLSRVDHNITISPTVSGGSQLPINFSPQHITLLPKIFMGVMMLPAAHRAYNFLRLSIRHKFAFKGIRGISAGQGDPAFNYSTTWGYSNQYDQGVVPASKADKAVVKASDALQAMVPPVVDATLDNASFETINADDNIELVNAKTA